MQSLKLITFDVTNTLIKVKHSIGYEYCKIASVYGIKCDTEEMVKNVNSNFRPVLRQLKKESPLYGVVEGISCNQWWNRAVIRTFSESGIQMSPELESKFHPIATHLYKLFSTKEPYQLLDGVTDLLNRLQSNVRSTNLKIGIISNSDERVPMILGQLGVAHFFSFIILPQFSKAEKPDPKVFQMALNQTDLKEPNQALHIGDNLDKDYFAAKNCNWNAILIDVNNSKSDSIDSKDKIRSIKELTSHEIVRKLI